VTKVERIEYRDAAKLVVERHYPDFLCAFIAGSLVRGEGTSASDIDVVVMMPESTAQVHRRSVFEEGWPVELFVQTPRAQDYFMHMDRKRGMPVIMDMVATGLALPGESPFVQARRVKAKAMLAGGPPPLRTEDLEDRRYVLTDLVDDLDPARGSLELLGILTPLYQRTGDLLLRGRGKWSGEGKVLGRLVRAADPALGAALEVAFRKAFLGDTGPVVTLVHGVLEEFGGRCFAGYRREAPPAWREFSSLDREP